MGKCLLYMLKYSWMSPRLFSLLDTRLNEISYNCLYCMPKETGYGFLHNPNQMKLFLGKKKEMEVISECPEQGSQPLDQWSSLLVPNLI